MNTKNVRERQLLSALLARGQTLLLRFIKQGSKTAETPAAEQVQLELCGLLHAVTQPRWQLFVGGLQQTIETGIKLHRASGNLGVVEAERVGEAAHALLIAAIEQALTGAGSPLTADRRAA